MRKFFMLLMSTLLLATMLSGCIWPWWEEDGRHGGGHGGSHGGGYGGGYGDGRGGDHGGHR